MKFIFIKWHYFWYKHHLKWSAVYTGLDNIKAAYHLDMFLHHNKHLCRLDRTLVEQHILKEFDRLFPDATSEERKLFSDRNV